MGNICRYKSEFTLGCHEQGVGGMRAGVEEAEGGEAEGREDVGADEDGETPSGGVVGFIEEDSGPFGREVWVRGEPGLL